MTALSPGDLALLRRFEPILCFNIGEQFYPMDVDRYLASARLCLRRPNGVVETLVPRGQLQERLLTKARRPVTDAVYYLTAVDPISPSQVLAFRHTSTLRDFHAGQGRLARAGLTARALDLLFSLTLLLRGRVPGGMAAAAALLYKEWQAQEEHYCYYGRVVHEHGYIILQYWFFYAFNDWRSSFHGVNDHEADWEMVSVYAVEDVAGAVQPCWVAYSSHEFEGDDLRRRWDDPQFEHEGDHPVVYVAAGSHANYYQAGEYQPTAELPYARAVLRIWRRIQRFWSVTLRQGSHLSDQPILAVIRIPFVDYARGDGIRIGRSQPRTWEMRLLQETADVPAPAWVDGYRGLWGLYTGDFIAGEDAPAGPKYNRNGTVSRKWYNPLGWSGLDKVPPPHEEAVFLETQQQRLREEQDELQRQIAAQIAILMGLEMESEAIYGLPHLKDRAAELQRKLIEESDHLDSLKERRASNAVVLETCAAYARRIDGNWYRGPHDHFRVPQLPTSAADLRLSRLAEVWGAISIGLLLLLFFVLTQFFASAWEMGLLSLIGIYIFIDALFRRQIQLLIRYGVVALALLTALLLIYEFFWQLVAGLVLFAGLLIIIENIRELRAS